MPIISTIAVSFFFVVVATTYHIGFLHPLDEWKSLVFYLFAGIFSAIVIFKKRTSAVSLNPLLISCAAYLLVSALSLFSKSAPLYEGLVAMAKMFVTFGFVYALSRMKASELKIILTVSTVVAAVIALAIMNDRYFFDFYDTGSFIFPIGHISYFSDYLLIHIPLAIILLAGTKGYLKFLWAAVISLLVVMTWESGTRASIVGLAAFFIVAFILLLKFKFADKSSCVLVVISLAAAVLFINVTKSVQLRPVSTSERIEEMTTPSANIRVLIFKKTLDASMDNIFTGHGIGSFKFIYPRYAYKGDAHAEGTIMNWFVHPHNEVLNQLFEVGVLGALCALSIVFLLFWAAIKFLISSEKKGEIRLVSLSVAGLAGILASVQFSTSFPFPITRLLVCFYCAVLLKYGGEFLPVFFSSEKKRVFSATLAIAILVAALVVTAYNSSLYASTQSARAKSASEKLRWAKLSYNLFPGGIYPLYTLSSLYLKTRDAAKADVLTEKMYKEFPEFPIVLEARAVSELLNGGKVENAKKLLQKAVENCPSFDSARQLLQKLQIPL